MPVVDHCIVGDGAFAEILHVVIDVKRLHQHLQLLSTTGFVKLVKEPDEHHTRHSTLITVTKTCIAQVQSRHNLSFGS